MDKDIVQKLSDYIASKVLKQPRRIISREEALISAGLIDSFSLVDLALFIEDSFHVRIEDTELNVETFDTLEQLVELIQTRLDQ